MSDIFITVDLNHDFFLCVNKRFLEKFVLYYMSCSGIYALLLVTLRCESARCITTLIFGAGNR